MDEKMVELFHKWLTIQLQDRLILSPNVSYNELVSAAIDQEDTMKACEAAEDKKRKRTMPGPSGGSSSGAPPHSMIRRLDLMQKHKFSRTCPDTLFVASALAHLSMRNSMSTFHTSDIPERTT
jgi:hypothetical protein